MNCAQNEDLFSDRFDGVLADHDRDAFDTHVADCAGCAANWSDYRAAVEVLRASGRRETSPELRATTLAAVAGAAGSTGGRRRAWPMLLAAAIGAAAALFVAWLLFDIDARRSLAIAVETGVVALERGETRSAGGVTLSRSASGALSVRAQPVAPRIVERVVEVPVERVVEVPVEVVVKVPVEVGRGPLFTIDVTPFAAALRAAGNEIGAGMLALAAASHTPRPQPTIPPGARPEPSPVARATAKPERLPATRGASLRVQRSDGHMMLETSGTLEELVPTLVAQLSSADPEVTSLIERRLAAIHEQAALDPAIRDALAAMPRSDADADAETGERSLFGGRRQPPTKDSPAVAWAAWWNANSALIAQSESL